MLTQGGAKLMDFGLAKPLGAQAAYPGSGTLSGMTALPWLIETDRTHLLRKSL
jgi:hypothetical protein